MTPWLTKTDDPPDSVSPGGEKEGWQLYCLKSNILVCLRSVSWRRSAAALKYCSNNCISLKNSWGLCNLTDSNLGSLSWRLNWGSRACGTATLTHMVWWSDVHIKLSNGLWTVTGFSEEGGTSKCWSVLAFFLNCFIFFFVKGTVSISCLDDGSDGGSDRSGGGLSVWEADVLVYVFCISSSVDLSPMI